MGRAPLVSIVTPSLNQGRFIERTIRSVLSQTYPYIDYWVIDGGSTDETPAILESFAGRLNYVSEADRGQADAINKGFARTRGEICAYLNADDVLLPTAVEKIVRCFHRRRCDIVYGRARLIDSHDRCIGEYRTLPFSMRALAEHSCIAQPAAFWRRALYDRIGGFDSSLRYTMDYDFWFRAARSGGIFYYLETVIAKARIHDDAKTVRDRLPMYWESIRTCFRHMGWVPRGPFQGLWQAQLTDRLPPALDVEKIAGIIGTIHWAAWRLAAGRARRQA